MINIFILTGFWPDLEHTVYLLISIFVIKEVAAVTRLLRRPEVRLVTLTGPGGVGKTRLEQGLSVLSGGARDLPARQQTLRGAIAWSYDLLSPEEQKLFRHFAIFVDGWSLQAAEAICMARGAVRRYPGRDGFSGG